MTTRKRPASLPPASRPRRWRSITPRSSRTMSPTGGAARSLRRENQPDLLTRSADRAGADSPQDLAPRLVGELRTIRRQLYGIRESPVEVRVVGGVKYML